MSSLLFLVFGVLASKVCTRARIAILYGVAWSTKLLLFLEASFLATLSNSTSIDSARSALYFLCCGDDTHFAPLPLGSYFDHAAMHVPKARDSGTKLPSSPLSYNSII